MVRQKIKKGPRVGTWEYSRIYAKERARELMRNKSIYSVLSFGILFAVLAMIGVAAVVERLCEAFLPLADGKIISSFSIVLLTAAMEFVILVFLIAPLIIGLLTFASRCVRGEVDSAASALFLFFSTKERRVFAYRRALNFFFTFIFACALIAGECALGAYVAYPLIQSGDYARATLMIIGTFIFVIATSVFVVVSKLSEHRVCRIFDTRADFPYSYSIRESTRVMKGRRGEALVMLLSFIPWIMLSALTLGVAFIFYVFPYYALADAVHGEKMLLDDKRQEDS